MRILDNDKSIQDKSTELGLTRHELSGLEEVLALQQPDMVRARADFNDATPMPGRVYTHAGIARLEEKALFRSSWIVVGRTDTLSERNTVTPCRVAGEELILCSNDLSQLRAFYNVCRHRGTRLVDESSSGLKNIQCPYHSWTYGLDGGLLGAPLVDDASSQGLGLVEVPIDSWNGFSFVCLDPSRTLAEQLCEAPDLDRFGLATLRTAAVKSYEAKVNWKLLCENYSECYHCAVVHPQLHRITHYQSGGDQEEGACFVGGPMKLNHGFNTMSMTGTTDRPSIPGLRPEDDDLVYYYVIYPNLWLSLHRDYVLVHILKPLSAGTTRIECLWLAHPDAMSAEAFEINDAVEFWDVTNIQDWNICERTQRGVISDGYQPATYQSGESCLHAFANWYLTALESGIGMLQEQLPNQANEP